MKKVTLFIDDDYSEVITITAIATRGTVTNVNITAHEINDGDFINIPAHDKTEENKELITQKLIPKLLWKL